MRKRAWTPGLVPDPSNRSRTLTLDGCPSAARFVASLRDESWAEYSRAIYGEPASATLLQNLELIRGVALHTPGHKVSDRRPLRCGEMLLSNVPGQGTRALQLWRDGRPPPFARSHAWVEAYRSRSTAGPEGAGYGCWLYRASGAGAWVNLGRTAAMSRTEAAARFGQLHTANATPITADQLECRASVGSWCIWVPADAARPLVAIGAASASRSQWDAATECQPDAVPPKLRGAGGVLRKLPCGDGVWALNARRQGLDSVQIFPTNVEARSELLLSADACVDQAQPIGACVCLPPSTSGAALGTSSRASATRSARRARRRRGR